MRNVEVRMGKNENKRIKVERLKAEGGRMESVEV